VKRILVLLILVCLALGSAASVYADGIDESQPSALPEVAAPEPVQPGEAAPKSAEQLPRGAERGPIRGRVKVLVPMPAPSPRSGEWGQCPLCGSTSKAEQELAIWAKVTGVPAEELKKHLSSGVGLGEICGAVVVARKQGKSLGQVIQQAKTDKVSMPVLAYAAGMSMEEFSREIAALHTAFLEQAAADGLITKDQVTKDQVTKGQEALAPDRLRRRLVDSRKAGIQMGLKPGLGMQYRVMPNLGSVGQQMIRFAGMRTMILMHWRNMMRGPVSLPSNGK